MGRATGFALRSQQSSGLRGSTGGSDQNLFIWISITRYRTMDVEEQGVGLLTQTIVVHAHHA